MFQVDVMSRTPIYEQLIEQMEKFILTGTLREGDQIPSVRSLSVKLSVNHITILKAFYQPFSILVKPFIIIVCVRIKNFHWLNPFAFYEK